MFPMFWAQKTQGIYGTGKGGFYRRGNFPQDTDNENSMKECQHLKSLRMCQHLKSLIAQIV